MAIGLSGCAMPVRAPLPAANGLPATTPAESPPVAESNEAPAVVPSRTPAVSVLYSGGSPTQTAISGHIVERLAESDFTIELIDIDRFEVPEPTATATDSAADIVAVVGTGALTVAQQHFATAQIVFSQVLEPGIASTATGRIHGVAPMPPPALQFSAWTAIDPNLKRIGLITSPGFSTGAADAERAAAAIGAELLYRVSNSDRETLYIFRRLADEIDGLWLAPDSAVLSAPVIDAILAYAAEANVGVLVFSESLLERGGLISVGASPEHIAATVVAAIETIGSGQAAYLPVQIPLEEGSVQINATVASRLGLELTTPIEWTIRYQQ
jgi:ABC-type uncharacterized transport system substrate-binding protein